MKLIRPSLRALLRGQSLVEFTILLPVLLMMLSGLIEFGFLLNTYLDLIDAAREAARFAANDDPTVGFPGDDYDPFFVPPKVNFWHRAFLNARSSLFTASDGRINWNTNDPKDCTELIDGNIRNINGDIVVSAFSVSGKTVVERFPAGDAGASNRASCLIFLAPPPPPPLPYPSKLTIAQVNALLSDAATPFPPNSGFIVVEIYYEYNMILGLPWITAFVPDPIVLYAYTVMPNTNVEPTPAPTPTP